ncbi:MAG: uroporphyrinogen decarboxylase family protein [Candidatus Caldatribacteriaceae bacterium]
MLREEILKTFEGKNSIVVWQPRLEHWYRVNNVLGLISERYHHLSITQLYRCLGASIRYYFGEGIASPQNYVICEYDGGVRVEEKEEGGFVEVFIRCPKGVLRGRKRLGEWGCSWYYVEYPIKKMEDLEVMEYVLAHTRYRFNEVLYEEAKVKIGSLGEIQFYWGRSPFQKLLLEYAGVENTFILLHDYPGRLQEYLKRAEESEDALFAMLAACPVKVLNFGENIDAHFNPPPVFEKYLLPYYRQRVKELHGAGKYCHIHIDGRLQPLLWYISDLPFDGIEGVTPFPQGDVSLEELREAVGDKVILDGIPALLFLPDYGIEELEFYTEKVFELFYPRIILGISDELPPFGDIDRVKRVTEIVEVWNREGEARLGKPTGENP